ncbi:MAG: hypothetical protein D6705_06305 [Deltaproteobacteria bacterium]|nr:MAG: hypothetical protein D6705_06305 [Deltaproteobacteria bacterium]
MIPQIEHAVERKARRRWLSFIGAFFLFEFVLWGTAIYVVHDDPSHAVVEDYDTKALAWDEHRLAEAASAALGWHADVRIAAREGRLAVEVRDRDGAPVKGAAVEAEVFHRARAGRKRRVVLTEEAPGVYGASLPVDRPGRWSVHLSAERGADRFLHDAEVFVPEGGMR